MDGKEAKLELIKRHQAFIKANKVKATCVTISRLFAIDLCKLPCGDLGISMADFNKLGEDAIIGRTVCDLAISIDDNFLVDQFEFK